MAEGSHQFHDTFSFPDAEAGLDAEADADASAYAEIDTDTKPNADAIAPTHLCYENHCEEQRPGIHDTS